MALLDTIGQVRTTHTIEFIFNENLVSKAKSSEIAKFYSLKEMTSPFPRTQAQTSPKKMEPDLIAKSHFSELGILAKSLGEVEVTKGCISTRDFDIYDRLSVYAVVRSNLDDLPRLSRLQELIQNIGAYEIHFWATTFRNAFSISKKRTKLSRPARAFKILYNLE